MPALRRLGAALAVAVGAVVVATPAGAQTAVPTVPTDVPAPVAVPSQEKVGAAQANPWDHRAIGVAATPAGDGCWVAYEDGTVATLSQAPHLGDASGIALAGPLVGMSPNANGDGYWLVASDGGVFSYGSAPFHGSMGGIPLAAPVFSMAPTATDDGYWMVARDGGIFAFGDAPFLGSVPGVVTGALDQPINGLSVSPSGRGYQMVARDGGVFAFGDSVFLGSLGGQGIDDIVGLAPTPSGQGYWLATSDAKVFAFGDAQPFDVHEPDLLIWGMQVTGIVSDPNEQGFRLLFDSGILSTPYGADPCDIHLDPRNSDEHGVHAVRTTFPINPLPPDNWDTVRFWASVGGQAPHGETLATTQFCHGPYNILDPNRIDLVIRELAHVGELYLDLILLDRIAYHGDCTIFLHLRFEDARGNVLDEQTLVADRL